MKINKHARITALSAWKNKHSYIYKKAVALKISVTALFFVQG